MIREDELPGGELRPQVDEGSQEKLFGFAKPCPCADS